MIGMKNTVFTGAGTAIITPFHENGVDWEKDPGDRGCRFQRYSKGH